MSGGPGIHEPFKPYDDADTPEHCRLDGGQWPCKAELIGRLEQAERRENLATERMRIAEAKYADLRQAVEAAWANTVATFRKEPEARHPDDCECAPCWQRGNYAPGVSD